MVRVTEGTPDPITALPEIRRTSSHFTRLKNTNAVLEFLRDHLMCVDNVQIIGVRRSAPFSFGGLLVKLRYTK